MSKAISNPAPVSNLPAQSPSLLARIATRYAVDANKMLDTLKATAFKGQVSNEQMMALLIVADQYQLNPFTREIYAFPDKNNGIVPVVGVDGWIRIINSNPDLESITFEDGPADETGIPQWIACAIKLKTRTAPIEIREYFAECKRSTGPWQSHPRRMLRHKALIQAARIALGFVGIYDPDEAERIANAIDVTPQAIAGKPKTAAPKARIAPPDTGTEDALQEPPISVDQITALLDQVREEGVDLNALLAQFEIGDLSELPARRYDSARNYIASGGAEG